MPSPATWTTEEDEALKQYVEDLGTKKWAEISAKLKTKSSKQCRRRWKNYLELDPKKGGWAEDEDKRLVELVGRYGNKWTLISQEIGGRTDNAVKNRYAALSKKFEKVLMAEGLERSNSGYSPCSSSMSGLSGGSSMAGPTSAGDLDRINRFAPRKRRMSPDHSSDLDSSTPSALRDSKRMQKSRLGAACGINDLLNLPGDGMMPASSAPQGPSMFRGLGALGTGRTGSILQEPGSPAVSGTSSCGRRSALPALDIQDPAGSNPYSAQRAPQPQVRLPSSLKTSTFPASGQQQPHVQQYSGGSPPVPGYPGPRVKHEDSPGMLPSRHQHGAHMHAQQQPQQLDMQQQQQQVMMQSGAPGMSFSGAQMGMQQQQQPQMPGGMPGYQGGQGMGSQEQMQAMLLAQHRQQVQMQQYYQQEQQQQAQQAQQQHMQQQQAQQAATVQQGQMMGMPGAGYHTMQAPCGPLAQPQLGQGLQEDSMQLPGMPGSSYHSSYLPPPMGGQGYQQPQMMMQRSGMAASGMGMGGMDMGMGMDSPYSAFQPQSQMPPPHQQQQQQHPVLDTSAWNMGRPSSPSGFGALRQDSMQGNGPLPPLSPFRCLPIVSPEGYCPPAMMAMNSSGGGMGPGMAGLGMGMGGGMGVGLGMPGSGAGGSGPGEQADMMIGGLRGSRGCSGELPDLCGFGNDMAERSSSSG